MTVGALQKQIEQQLTDAGCDSPAFSCVCLLEDIGGIGRGQVPGTAANELPKARVQAVLTAARERAAGRPLQYILGSWDFLSLTLKVGEGVLIPRPETELLCEKVADALAARGGPATVWDLCAGSGCVGLGIASLYAPVTVTEMELSDEAFPYLCANVAAYPQYAVTTERVDVLAPCKKDGMADAIVSNPPYIPTGDLPGLQREVQREPQMALDGAADGLKFYRAIAGQWSRKLRPGGLLAVEIGIGQGDDVANLWRQNGLTRVRVLPDFAGIDRVVMGFKA